MQTTMRSPAVYTGSPLAANLLGIAIAALVVAVLTNTPLPLLGSDRGVFIAMVILGMTMCSLGGVGRAPKMHGWTHPITLFGIAVGTLMLVLTAAVLIGQTAFLDPFAFTVGVGLPIEAARDRAAIIVLAGVMSIKWIVGLLFVR
jgi:hypothetical protein